MRLLKLVGAFVVVKTMSKYRVQTFKQHATEVRGLPPLWAVFANVVRWLIAYTYHFGEGEKVVELQGNKLDVLSDEKKAKIKKLAREYINKVLIGVHVHGIGTILARAEIHCSSTPSPYPHRHRLLPAVTEGVVLLRCVNGRGVPATAQTRPRPSMVSGACPSRVCVGRRADARRARGIGHQHGRSVGTDSSQGTQDPHLRARATAAAAVTASDLLRSVGGG